MLLTRPSTPLHALPRPGSIFNAWSLELSLIWYDLSQHRGCTYFLHLYTVTIPTFTTVHTKSHEGAYP